MRRHDTQSVGAQAEALAEFLLRERGERGFEVRNLNEERFNNPLYDLVAGKNRNEVEISVKCARAKRQLRLGSARILAKMRDDCVVMGFLPTKGTETEFSSGGYQLLIIPGKIARVAGLKAHDHYVKTHPGSKDHSVVVTDKVDRNEGAISGAVFQGWHE